MKKIVISGGGTAGHITPALSIARHLDQIGWEISFIGNSDSLEKRLVEEAGFKFYSINIQKLYRKITVKNLEFPFKLILSIIKCCYLLNQIKPDAYLGTGGYVSAPGGFAARLIGYPIFLQEQNSFPGLTTRFLARSSKIVFLGNQQANKYLRQANTLFTGNPINPDLVDQIEIKLPSNFFLSKNKKKIFLLGGSQGSVILNQNFALIIDKLLAMNLEIIWQTGKYSYEKYNKQFNSCSGIYLFDYTTDITGLYRISNLVIARAGALTLAELETLKIPAILIPLPAAAENHQYHNALQQADKGIAEIIEQKDLTASLLLKKVLTMIEKIDDYNKNFSEAPHRSAAGNIAAAINKSLGGIDQCLEK